MKHILSISGLLLVTALVLSGCKSSKTVQSGKMPDAVPAFDVNAYKNRVVARSARPSALTARLALTLKAGTKEISVNGSLRMQRDDVIQLSLTFLGMEVGRMEFTQQDVLLVDRFNKQYVRVPYGELDFLQRARLDFEALQALFWNELFVPGSSGKLSELMSRFKVSEYGDYVRFVLDDAPQLTYDSRRSGATVCSTRLLSAAKRPATRRNSSAVMAISPMCRATRSLPVSSSLWRGCGGAIIRSI